jgi:hypothetical protein
MIGDVKHLRPELHAVPFPEFEVLGNGQIQVVEASIAEYVSARISKRSERRGKQK